MKSVFKPLLITGLLAAAGFAALAQAPVPPRGDMMGREHDHGHRLDPAKMQERMAHRQTQLKAQLKLTPDQEGAWTAYTEAMKPPVGLMARRPDRAELDKLTTPERIDRMNALRAQRMSVVSTEMNKRGEATKAFYATLTPEQQKMFDARATRQHGHRGHEGRHGGHRGEKASG